MGVSVMHCASRMIRSARVRFGILVGALILGGSPLQAQEINPLDVEPDANGVDLLYGKVHRRMPTLSIPAAPELTFENLSDFWPVLEGRVPSSGVTEATSYSINAGGIASDSFSCNTAGTCTNANGRGSTIFGGYTVGPFYYTQGGSGKRITFSTLYGDQNPPAGGDIFYYVASSVSTPGGPTLTFAYDSGQPFPGYNVTSYRPSVVTSTSGYQLRFTYQSNDPTSGYWRVLSRAEIVQTSAPNTPLASLDYSNSWPVVTITDIAGREFECLQCQNSLVGPDPGLEASFTLDGEASPTFEATYTHTSNGHDLDVTSDGVTYTYEVVDDTTMPVSDAVDNITITAPNGFYRYVEVTNIDQSSQSSVNPPRRRIDSITNSENGTTTYTYDVLQRVESITYPEGNAVSVEYDGGGNITEMRTHAKPGSGQADIVQTASYNHYFECDEITCFLPEWTEDALGNRTEYTWSNTHGGLLTQLDPVDGNNQRRKVKNTYDGSGRLIREEVCATSGSGNELTCGTADSFVREIAYFGGTRLPASETLTDGIGTAPITTTYSYDTSGRLLSENGPLPGSYDASYYHYDILGRRIWEIGPRNEQSRRAATRTTYRDSDDQPELVESGYVDGVGNTSSFVAVREVGTQYNSRRLATLVETREDGADHT